MNLKALDLKVAKSFFGSRPLESPDFFMFYAIIRNVFIAGMLLSILYVINFIVGLVFEGKLSLFFQKVNIQDSYNILFSHEYSRTLSLFVAIFISFHFLQFTRKYDIKTHNIFWWHPDPDFRKFKGRFNNTFIVIAAGIAIVFFISEGVEFLVGYWPSLDNSKLFFFFLCLFFLPFTMSFSSSLLLLGLIVVVQKFFFKKSILQHNPKKIRELSHDQCFLSFKTGAY